MTITFVGHSEVPEGERIKKLVKEVMIKKVSDVEELFRCGALLVSLFF